MWRRSGSSAGKGSAVDDTSEPTPVTQPIPGAPVSAAGLRVITIVLAVLLGLCAIGLVAVVVLLGGMISAL